MSQQKYPTPRAAIDALYATLRSILDDGYSVKGIDPGKVAIFPDEPPRMTSEKPSPAPMPVLFPAAASGDVCSTCGGSNIVRTGACHTCTDCGSTTSCG